MAASASTDGIQRWNATAGTPAWCLCVAADRDGWWNAPHGQTLLAFSGSGGEISCWDATAKTRVASWKPTIRRPRFRLLRYQSFSWLLIPRLIPVEVGEALTLVGWAGPNGPMLAFASRNGTVQRWNAISGASAGGPMTGHTGSVTALVAWDGPDGPMLASGGEDGTVQRWDAVSARRLAVP